MTILDTFGDMGTDFFFVQEFKTLRKFFFRRDRLDFSLQTNRMRYHKTGFCIQLETKFFFNFRKKFSKCLKIRDFQMTGNDPIFFRRDRFDFLPLFHYEKY
jgi:hypothetical protein